MSTDAAYLTDDLELTILMPCLNEIETISTCVLKARSFLDRAGVKGEVLIADNGSVDGSIEAAEAAGARVISVPKKGYGSALRGGIAEARGRYVIMGDADDSYDFTALDNFLEELRAGSAVVVGNRFRGGIAPGAMPFLHRYLGNPVLSFLGRRIFELSIRDFHCGLRGFDKQAITSLGLSTPGMEFASEMIVKSGLHGYKMVEVPTTLKPDGRSRPPHLKTWRDGWRHLKFLLIHSPKWLFFIPGAFLTAFGVLMCLLLFRGPVTIGSGIVLDTNSFLAGCLLAIIGVQILTFGALARYYASLNGILPRGGRSDFLVRFCTTDSVSLVALGMVVLGAGMFLFGLKAWASVDFGNLQGSIVPRLVAAGLSISAIGLQLAFAAFLFGLLTIPRRD